MENLRQKTAKSLLWSAIDKVGVQVFAFIVGVITARLLSPKDFGLIGALAIFTILSNTIVESGFTAALVRRRENTNGEYTATFCVNLLLSIVLYVLLFFCAPLIASYFQMPELCDLSRFLFLAIVINSFGLVQNVILVKNLDFKKLTKINLISVVVAGCGVVGLIVFAHMSYWALAWQQFLQVLVRTILLWFLGGWKKFTNPTFSVIKELFSFSFILLITSIVTATIRYIYNIIIGRLYSAEELGYYSQSYKYQQIPSSIISGTLASVAYPVLAKLNDDAERQKSYFRKMVRISAFWTFPLLLGLIVVANDFITILLTEKWLPAVPYLQILLLAGVFYPFHTLALNLMTVRGFPMWNFGLEMIRNAFVIVLLILFHQSIQQMLISFCVAELVSLIIDMILVWKKLHYTLFQQIWDVLPYLLVTIFMLIVVWIMNYIPISHFILFPLQVVMGALVYFVTLHLWGSKLLQETFEMLVHRK